MTTQTTTRTAEFPDISALVLANELGDVRLRCTSTDGAARVTLTTKGDVDLDLVTLRPEGHRLTVDVPPLLDRERPSSGFSFRIGPVSISSGASRVDVDVELPHGSSITAKTKSGDVTVSGEAGAVKATAGSGDVRLEHAQGVQLTTGSGDVSVRTCHGGAVTTGSGDITIEEVAGDTIQCRAGSGDVTLRHTQVQRVTSATGSGDITLHLGQGSFECKTGTGDVDVTVPSGIPVWLDLSSGTGSVARDLEPVGPPQEGQPHLRVMARSGVGSIRVHH